MKKILVIGAGRSATTLIEYLLGHAEEENWMVTVGDYNEELAIEKVDGHARGRAIRFDVNHDESRRAEISEADLVISMLPPHMHVIPANDCLDLDTHMVTASYVSKDMQALDADVRQAGLIFLNECGVDPGIDHMSTMEMVERVRAKGGKVLKFRSYCGALVAPESNNMWGYKFTWAPRNIIVAGQGIARYRKNGVVKYLPYHHLFSRTDMITVPGYGDFEAYANRDSVKYTGKYDMQGIDTLYRATLRVPGYCEMWNAFIQLGFTDPDYRIPHSKGMTYRDFVFSFINEVDGLSDEASFAKFLREEEDSELMKKLLALHLLSDRTIPIPDASPADILGHILQEQWVFEEGDVDMVVMQHQLDYELGGKQYRLVSSMVDKGRDNDNTAISRTVGLPVAIAAQMILNGKVTTRGVVIPTTKDIYGPVMDKLEEFDIVFTEEEVAL